MKEFEKQFFKAAAEWLTCRLIIMTGTGQGRYLNKRCSLAESMIGDSDWYQELGLICKEYGNHRD